MFTTLDFFLKEVYFKIKSKGVHKTYEEVTHRDSEF